MKRIDETDRLSNVNVSVPNNYIPKCKRGIFSHAAEGWNTTKILMQYFDLLSDCATPRPSIKDVNLFRGEIIMILYKYFLFS